MKPFRIFFNKYKDFIDEKKIIIVIIMSLVSVVINVCLPLFTQRIIDDGLLKADLKVIINSSLLMLFVFMLHELIDLYRETIRVNLYLTLKRNIERTLLNDIWRSKYSNIINKKGAEIIVNIDYDSDQAASLFDREMLFAFVNVFNIVGGCIGLAYINWKIMIGILLFIPVKMIMVSFFSKRNKKNVEQYLVEREVVAGFEEDSVDGIKELKMYGLYDWFDLKYQKLLDQRIAREKKLYLLPQINASLDSTLAQMCIVFVYVIGGLCILNQQMTVGSIMAFATYCAYVVGPLETLLNVRYKLSSIIPSLERLNETNQFSEEENVAESTFEENVEICLKLKNIRFSYDKKTDLIKNLNVDISRKGVYLIKGANGKGKSTLINIIMRLLDYDEGDVEANGKPIDKYSLDEYRHQIAYVGQEPFLFKDSIYNNLTLNIDVSKEKVLETCRLCGFESLIQEKSFDYDVGSNGVNLSGGQKQKIAIARAILSDRKMIIMDEATSNLDKESKNNLYNLISEMKKEKMIILISHDDDVMQIVDEVIYI